MSEFKLQLHNNLSGEKEVFSPLDANRVRMYVCGITPYDVPHLGHGRCYVAFDILFRLLQRLGYGVTYCRNFTDIDDKIIEKAIAQYGDPQKYASVANEYIPPFHHAMQQLGCLSPDHEPRVTENIAEIIAFIENLIESDAAYVINSDVYFSIDSFAEYGKLSGQKVDQLRAGERVEVNDEKRDPLDFALWKSEAPGTFFDSPWGFGRPGWHIECSALAKRYLADTIDIHGGGRDLLFPHHENEIAQTESLTRKLFARYWVHNGFVQINKEKMSKSLGNFFTLNEVFEKIDPMVVRYYFVTHHYAAPMEFNFDDIAGAGKSYKRLCKVLDKVEPCTELNRIQNNEVAAQMLRFLCDDLNTPGMLGVVFEQLSVIAKEPKTAEAVAGVLKLIGGLTFAPIVEKSLKLTPEIERLVAERAQARAQRDWAKADAIRDKLHALGYQVQDNKAQ